MTLGEQFKEHINAEQMKRQLANIRRSTGVSFTPGEAHLPTGHTIPVRNMTMATGSSSPEEALDWGVGAVHARVPLRMVGGDGADLYAGEDYAELLPSTKGNLWNSRNPKPGDALKETPEYHITKESGPHVESVLNDYETMKPPKPKTREEKLEILKSAEISGNPRDLEDFLDNTTEKPESGTDFLSRSSAHIETYDTSGQLPNRYFNMYTGEFDDHILN